MERVVVERVVVGRVEVGRVCSSVLVTNSCIGHPVSNSTQLHARVGGCQLSPSSLCVLVAAGKSMSHFEPSCSMCEISTLHSHEIFQSRRARSTYACTCQAQDIPVMQVGSNKLAYIAYTSWPQSIQVTQSTHLHCCTPRTVMRHFSHAGLCPTYQSHKCSN